MMEIKNAYVVYVDFDFDIDSETVGTRVFAGDNAESEVRALVRQALIDLDEYTKKMRNKKRGCYIGNEWVHVDKIIKNDSLLDAFINCGGKQFGNWEIDISKTRNEVE